MGFRVNLRERRADNSCLRVLEQGERVAHHRPRRVAPLHAEQCGIRKAGDHPGIGHRQGRGSVQDDQVVFAADTLQQGGHRLRHEEAEGMDLRRPGRDVVEAGEVVAPDDPVVVGLAEQQVGDARRRLRPEHPADGRLADVAVDEQHALPVHRGRAGHGDGGGRLALARAGGGDHHNLGRVGAEPERGAERAHALAEGAQRLAGHIVLYPVPAEHAAPEARHQRQAGQAERRADLVAGADRAVRLFQEPHQQQPEERAEQRRGRDEERRLREGGQAGHRRGGEDAPVRLLDRSLADGGLAAFQHRAQERPRGLRLALQRVDTDLRALRAVQPLLLLAPALLEADDAGTGGLRLGVERLDHAAGLRAHRALGGGEAGSGSPHIRVPAAERGGEAVELPTRLVAGGPAGDEVGAAKGGGIRAARAAGRIQPRLGTGELVAGLDEVRGDAADLLGAQGGVHAAGQAGLAAELRNPPLIRLHLLPELGDAAVEPVIGPADGGELLLQLVGDVELGRHVGDGRRELRVLGGEADLQDAAVAHHLHLEPALHRLARLDLGKFGHGGVGDRSWRDGLRQIRREAAQDVGKPGAQTIRQALGPAAVLQPPGKFLPLRQAETRNEAPGDGKRADDLHLARQHGIRRALIAQDALELARRILRRLEHDGGRGGVARRQALRRDEGDHREQEKAGNQHPPPASQRAEKSCKVQPLRLDWRRLRHGTRRRPALLRRTGVGDGTVEHGHETPPRHALFIHCCGAQRAPLNRSDRDRFRHRSNKAVMTRYRKETRSPPMRRLWHERQRRS